MSITRQIFQGFLKHRTSGYVLRDGARGMHSIVLTSARIGKTPNQLIGRNRTALRSSDVFCINSIGRSTSSVFILSRNESTSAGSGDASKTFTDNLAETVTANSAETVTTNVTETSAAYITETSAANTAETFRESVVETSAANIDEMFSETRAEIFTENIAETSTIADCIDDESEGSDFFASKAESISSTGNTQLGSMNPASTVSTTSQPLEASQQTLIFESIPEPPSVPVEELVASVLGSGGEPTLASLGLGSWAPSGMIQQCLEFFHVGLGMPWWGAILTGTLIVRMCLFPLVVKSQRNAAKMQNNMPQLQVLQAKMTEARQTGNALLSAKYGQEMMVFMKEKEISPFKNMIVPLAMAPVFISFFFGLRQMANLPVESLKTGGLFWFTDLTLADPFYLLPLITSLTVWITLEVGVDGVKLNATHGHLVKYFMRAIPVVMFPFAINFPAAILCYWVCTNAISLVQVSVMKLPSVRTKLNIEPLRVITPDMVPEKKKGFKDSLKDSWTNMKITREMEDRHRYDEISFKRAGKGPIPKTYKYDPTKADPLKDAAAAAMQAKRK